MGNLQLYLEGKNKMTHKDLPVSVQNLLSKEQKRQIDEGLWLGNTFLITGPQGPTGKTTLTNALRKIGAIAVEPWELEEISLSKFFVPKKIGDFDEILKFQFTSFLSLTRKPNFNIAPLNALLQTKAELIDYIVDHQPYYKKSIPEVIEYFADLYGFNS